jgi:hypothetical protein
VLAAFAFRRAYRAPPGLMYWWDVVYEAAAAAAANDPEGLELPSPEEVPVIWQRPLRVRNVVVPFRRPSGGRAVNDDSVT